MAKEIISDIITIHVDNIKTNEIETNLLRNYGEIIRWAIVDVDCNNNLKISVTYEKEV